MANCLMSEIFFPPLAELTLHTTIIKTSIILRFKNNGRKSNLKDRLYGKCKLVIKMMNRITTAVMQINDNFVHPLINLCFINKDIDLLQKH